MTKKQRLDMEKKIDVNFLDKLKDECEAQLSLKRNHLSKAQKYSGQYSEKYKKSAENVDLSSCKKYEEFVR